MHEPFRLVDQPRIVSAFGGMPVPPNQLRWDPLPLPGAAAAVDFVDGLVTMAGSGDAAGAAGCAIHVYAANRSMTGRFFYDADGELLIVPQQGRLLLATEFGRLIVAPKEIAVVPRGVRFRVELPDGAARGYVCENYGALFKLPDLGVIGSNGLANPRDFQTPVAWYEDVEGDFELVAKFGGNLWSAKIGHSPLDVVAWHGNYAPYKYDLARFNTIGSISYDHPDPSIFLVLQSPSAAPGLRRRRLRHLPAADPGDGGHVPAALVPPQRRERVHGPDRGRVRRQGRGLRPGRREPAQLDDRPRARRRHLRQGVRRSTPRSPRASATPWPS